MNTGINRIRLEFKVWTRWSTVRFQCVLIESDWNLKKIMVARSFPEHPVLVESDWNLKMLSQLIDYVLAAVLIESDWILKDNTESTDIYSCTGINRIRLEFKS